MQKLPMIAPRTARRSVSLSDADKAQMPKLTLVRRSIKRLVAPRGYRASMILKRVGDGDQRGFACWLVVGRFAREAMSLPYELTDDTTIRCDIPDGHSMRLSALQPHLEAFLAKKKPDDPPIITGEDD